jgi:Type ISP C-terminal specificity domain/N-6 DNA Methylase
MVTTPLDVYRRQIEKELQAGNATEQTHRPALKTLLEALAPKITATNEPKRVDCGAPDFSVTEKRAHGPVTVGHIEAKDVGKDLDEAEKSEQMRRYLPALPNLILTDYLEFRWYIGGEHRQSARLAHLGRGGRLVPEKDGDGATSVSDLLAGFLSQKAEPISDPKALALRMARLTHFIRDMIVAAFEGGRASATLRDLHEAFKKALIPDLQTSQFADMFAQTLAYGLFAARVNHRGPRGSFKRVGAAAEIPKTNPFLRRLFETITGADLDEEPYAGFVDDLTQLLADTDMEAVLADFGKRTARQDPVVHFYETFLAAYDPKLREARGVYYTPEPVVSYIVRSVDYLLKTRFGCPNGLADTATVEYEREEEKGGKARKVKATSPRVLILDPACGTGTFLYTVIDHIRSEFMRQGNAGMWSSYVRDHLLRRIFGFELLMAPYAVAHFKLGMQLAGHDLTPSQREKWTYDFTPDERLRVYLTNTLEEAERRAQMEFGFLRTLTEEANAAVEIKRTLPILAVIGNPPYANFGQMNNGQWITALMRDWKPTGERKWNPDDFMKFMRWGQWRIERTGSGVLALITNNTYMDGITRRTMRESILKTFTEVYILDLHGSAKKNEACPDGSRDENVFDIQQGVAIGLFVKQPDVQGPGRVHHADLWGVRHKKYEFLFENEVKTTHWTDLQPKAPNFFFVPRGEANLGEYERGWSLPAIFALSNSGVQTKKDSLTIHFTLRELRRILDDIHTLKPEALREKYDLGSDGRDWTVALAIKDVLESKGQAFQIQYRPFDVRWSYFTGTTKGFIAYPRADVTRQLLQKNVALASVRQIAGVPDQCEVFVSRRPMTDRSMFSTHGTPYLFPLYVYAAAEREAPEHAQLEVELAHWPATKHGRVPNFTPEFIAEMERRLELPFVSDGQGDLKRTFGPEDVVNYIYAIFHSPTYRIRFAEFLKSDFPRVPLTSDVNLFRVLCAKGAELVALHLLESPKLGKPVSRYPVKGSDLVDKGFPKYVAPGEPEPGSGKPVREGRVYINRREPQAKAEGQYFEGVAPEVWSFHIGGYQVCEKWLKDRRGRTVTYDDQMHYCKIVTALSETIRLMAEIDAAVPKWPIE